MGVIVQSAFAKARYVPFVTDAGLVWMQWIAVAAMLLDHVNWFWFAHGGNPQNVPTAWMNDIGRIAFPLFAFTFAVNLDRITRSRDCEERWRRQAWRLVTAGAVAQVVYWPLRGAFVPLNVMWTFLLSSIVFVRWLHSSRHHDIIGRCVSVALAIIFGSFVEYAWFGVALVTAAAWLVRSQSRMSKAGFALALLALCLINRSLYALLALVPIVTLRHSTAAPHQHGKWLYSFYPIHLMILLLVRSVHE